MTQQNNNVIYVVNLGAEAKRWQMQSIDTRGGGGRDGASKLEIEARQKLQNSVQMMLPIRIDKSM